MTETTPNWVKIHQIAKGCINGVLSPKEGIRILSGYLDPANHIPRDEMDSLTKDDKLEKRLVDYLYRIDTKLDMILSHIPDQVPDEINPDLFCKEALLLAQEGKKFEAIQIHRNKTGCLFAEAKQVMDRALAEIEKNKS